MKKLVILAAAAAIAMPASAQGFLGKLKKAVQPDQPARTEAKAPTKDWPTHFSLEVVSCEGDPVSGEVLLTLVAQKRAAERLEIGCKDQTFAVDPAGKRYVMRPLDSRSRSTIELIDGVPQRYQLLATGVAPGTPQFPIVTLGFYAVGDPNLGSNMAGVDPIRLEGVPVNWSATPADAQISMPWQLKEICGLDVASCTRNPDDNSVTLVLAATTVSPQVNLNINNGRPLDVYDVAGNTYPVAYSGTEGVMGRQLDTAIPTSFVYTISGIDPAATAIPLVKIPFYATDYANDLRAGSNMADIAPILIRSIPITQR